MSEHSVRLIEEIRRRLAEARRRLMLTDLALGAMVTLGVATAFVLVGALLEASVWLGSTARWVFVAAFLIAVGVTVGYMIVRPILRGAGVLRGWEDAAIARLAGTRHPEVADRLSNLLDLADGRAGFAPTPLVDSAVGMLGREVAPVRFERIEDLRPLRRAAPAAGLPAAGVLVALLFAPGFGDAVQRLFTPAESFEPPAPFTLVVEPGDVELVRGGELSVLVHARGASIPRTVTLEIQRDGEERVEPVRLLAESDGTFRHAEGNVRNDLRYRATAEGISSPWHRARVVHRPVLQNLGIVLRPPGYTGLPPQALASGVGDITALPGTIVELRLGIDGAPVDSAAVLFASGATSPLEVRGREAAGRFTVRGHDQYTILLVSREGHVNADPITYGIRALTDSPPQIRLIEPGDGTLSESLVTRVRARVTDDFGFSRAVLRFRLAERDGQPVDVDYTELSIPITPDALDQDIAREWLLGAAGLDLRPGDAVAYHVEVWDNNAVAGYQSARTSTHFLRYPSVSEQFDRLDETEDATREGLDGLRDEADDARRSFEELRNELMRKQDADWEDHRQIEQLLRQHEQLDEGVRQSVEQMQEMLDRMRENDLVSEETARMYEELQRVIEEIADPELLEQLRQLQEAMMEMNFEDMLQNMERFDFDEQAFRDRLERALELFERLRTSRELDEAARRAQDIAEQEERLGEETEALQDASDGMTDEERQAEQDRLAEQQQRAQEAADALREQLEQLQQKLQDQGRQEMSQDMQQMQQQLQDAMEQMQENSDQLQDGQLNEARDGQQQLQQMMEQMMDQLQMMGQQMAGQQQQRNVSGLRRVLDDVLTLSFEQENLRDRSVGQRPESPAVRQNAQQQVELAAGLSTVSDTLRALSREIPEMERVVQQRAGEALRLMGSATESLAEREPPRAAGHQKGAMTSLNDLAVLLSDLLEQMMSGSGGGSGEMSLQQMMQQLQQMGQDQQQLNQQIQQMLNDMQGQRLSIDQQERLQQMRGQQEAIRQQLDELIREGNLDSQSRSELQRIAEEMDEVMRQMDAGRLDRNLRERQENILTRLLEVRDSINERGQREEREGTPADQRERDVSPPDLPEQEEIDRIRRDLIRALDSGYAPDYQELIKRYFELLQRRHEGE